MPSDMKLHQLQEAQKSLSGDQLNGDRGGKADHCQAPVKVLCFNGEAQLL